MLVKDIASIKDGRIVAKDGGEGSGVKGHQANAKDSITFSSEEALDIAQRAGIDVSKIDMKEFALGLSIEQEHKDLTNGDPIMTAKIVMAHLNEISDYYSRLEKMEIKAENQETKDGGVGAARRGTVQ